MGDFVPVDDKRTPTAKELAIACNALAPELMEKVKDVIYELYRGIADKDCWCDDLDEHNRCEPCVARSAIEKLKSLAYPVVRSIHAERLQGAEAVFFEEWVSENTKRPGFNGGLGLLEAILSTQYESWSFSFGKSPIPVTVSQRDMDVATAVIQWLGTNCGLSFLRKCEREIEKRQCVRSNFDFALARSVDQIEPPSEFEQIARLISERHSPNSSIRERLKADILRAMKLADAGKTMKELSGELYKEPGDGE